MPKPMLTGQMQALAPVLKQTYSLDFGIKLKHCHSRM